jgi:hypothetical protein
LAADKNMNPKQAAPLIVTLPAIAAAAPPLIIGGAIVIGGIYLLEWLFSDDKDKKPESVPASTPERPALVIPSISGGNSVQIHRVPLNSGGKPNMPSAPSVSTSVIVPASPVRAIPKIPVPPPSVIPAIKIAPQVPQPSPKKFIAWEDIANVFHRGGRTLTRTAAVAALKSIGFGKSASYAALTPDGRFAAWLQFAPDGIITWTDGHKA